MVAAVMGPSVPYAAAGGYVDHVRRVEAILERLKDQVPGLEWWTRQRPQPAVYVLRWTANGTPREHDEPGLRELADWADRQWPPE